jgi:hypothetical protein
MVLDNLFQPANCQSFVLERHKHVLEVVGNVDLADRMLTELDFFVFDGVCQVFSFDKVERVLSPDEFAGLGTHEDSFQCRIDFYGSDLLGQGDCFLELELPADLIEFF